MARGIISTILGGVAGGLEGLGVQQERRRLEEQRRQEREDILAQQRFANEIAVIGAGGQIGGAPRIRQDVAAPAALPRSSALDSALFAGEQVDRGEGLVDRPDFSQFARPRTEFVVDPDYQTIGMGDQEYSFLTPEARERRAEAERARNAQVAAAIENEKRQFELFKVQQGQEFQMHRDSVLYGNQRAMAELNHELRMKEIETRGTGGGLEGLSVADIDRVLMQVFKDGKPVFDEYGQPAGVEPYTNYEMDRLREQWQATFMPQGVEGSAGGRSIGTGTDRPFGVSFESTLLGGDSGRSFQVPGRNAPAPRTQSSAPVDSYVPTTSRTRTPEDLRWWPIPQGARSAAAGFFMPPTQGRPSPWDR
jgi:hypothetical protein